MQSFELKLCVCYKLNGSEHIKGSLILYKSIAFDVYPENGFLPDKIPYMFIKLKHYFPFCSSLNPNSLSSTKRLKYCLSFRLDGLNSLKDIRMGINFTCNRLWFVWISCLPNGRRNLLLGDGFYCLFSSSVFFRNADCLLLIGLSIFIVIGSFYCFISNTFMFLINGLSDSFYKFYALLLYFLTKKLLF